MPELITPGTLKELVSANAVRSATVYGSKGGYLVLVRYGIIERVVAARSNRGALRERKFPTLDSVDNFLRKRVHITDYHVNSAEYEPPPRQAREVEASQRLKQLHEAAAYDKWYREQVQASLDDPRPGIPNDEVKKRFAAKRQALRQRLTDESQS
jgi:hypothetical protein